MNKYLKTDYLLLLFLFVNITAEHALLASISKTIFYGTLGLSVPFVILKSRDVKNGFKACPYLVLWIVIYITYQFSAGWNTINKENLFYLVAKIATFCMISMSITENFDFYLKKVSESMGYIIVLLLLVGFNDIDSTGSHNFGFYNNNAACAISVIGASCFLFREEKLKILDYMCLSICILACLLGGSRNSIAMLVIIFVFKYGISYKLIIFIIAIYFIVFTIFPFFDMEFRAIERVIGTLNGTVEIDREDQRLAAEWMIEQHKWEGNGFVFSNYGEALYITEYGSHNGYLDTLESMGYIFGGAWLIVFIVAVIRSMSIYKEHDIFARKYLGILMSIVFASMNEQFLTGVNQFVTNMFFVSLMILSTYKYRKPKSILSQQYESNLLR